MLPLQFLSEEEFVAAIRSRSAAGAEYLYDQHASILFKIIFLTIRDQALAETTLEQVMMHIWNSTDEFLSQSSTIGIWMAGTARHFAKDALKSSTVVYKIRDTDEPGEDYSLALT